MGEQVALQVLWVEARLVSEEQMQDRAASSSDSAHGSAYDEARVHHRWVIPDTYNIGVDVCDRWADREPERTAIIEYQSHGLQETSFEALRQRSNRIANLLTTMGLSIGDRVAVLASQRVDTAASHIAIYKAGAIAVPLFTLFGPDALRHRLADSGARFLIADAAGVENVREIRSQLPSLERVIPLDASEAEPALDELIADVGADFQAVRTRADDPALIIYTSGTTGTSKGALHAHRVLLGHLPGVEMSHDGFPKPGDRMWTPADWAWIGGLLDVLLPSLHHGVAVVAHRFGKFSPERAYELIAECGVRNMFLPPTALKMMRTIAHPTERWQLNIRSIAGGGESLGGELLDWGREALGITINEFYGQTECNMVLSSCAAWFKPRTGAIGRAVPGHTVAVIGNDGKALPQGEQGEIAVLRPDPVMFLGYWQRPDATALRFRGDWLLTGDWGWIDDEGFIHFVGRADDVITSAGYRIGPGEIEDCVLAHPAVQAVGVVGVPDPDRTEVVAAFVVLRTGIEPSDALADDLRMLVRSRLGAHQYPRLVRFIDALPTTTTGKVIRRQLRAWASAG